MSYEYEHDDLPPTSMLCSDPAVIRAAALSVCTHNDAENATVILQALGVIPYRGVEVVLRDGYGKPRRASRARSSLTKVNDANTFMDMEKDGSNENSMEAAR